MAETKLGYQCVNRLIIENPWFCKNPLFWTAQHLDLIKIRFRRIDALPEIRDYYEAKEDDPLYQLAQRFAKSITSGPKSAAFAKILDLMDTNLSHFPQEKAIFMFDTKDVHVSDCYIYHYGSPALCEVPIVGYFHYDDVKWARLKSIRPQSNPGDGGNPPMARVCRIRLRNVTPTEWSEDPYLVGLILNFPVRLLVSTEHDPMTAHVFTADIGIRLLECIYDPALCLETVIWPTIQHSELPIEPYNTFADRVVTELLGFR
ncbi:hypothetical protein ACHAP8_009997 [Fusarium lateritium]